MARETVSCPGCGAKILSTGEIDASAACRKLYDDVLYYTLSLRDTFFIHQLAVDAYAAQHAGPHVKPISTAFALVGLYLVWERDFTGRQVQRAHMALANTSKEWPRFSMPGDRAWLTVEHVVDSPDERKQEAIREWSRSVWECWKPQEVRVADLLRTHIGL